MHVTVVGSGTTWSPTYVEVTPGSTVTFTWQEPTPRVLHNLRIDGYIDSDPSASATHSITFNTPGSYTYICDIHPTTMRGVVVVG